MKCLHNLEELWCLCEFLRHSLSFSCSQKFRYESFSFNGTSCYFQSIQICWNMLGSRLLKKKKKKPLFLQFDQQNRVDLLIFLYLHCLLSFKFFCRQFFFGIYFLLYISLMYRSEYSADYWKQLIQWDYSSRAIFMANLIRNTWTHIVKHARAVITKTRSNVCKSIAQHFFCI